MAMVRLRAATRLLPLVLLVLSCFGVSGQDSGLTVGATGSGFVVASDGYILTNEHVIHGATKVTVHAGGQVYEATVLAASEANDLALLKIPASGLTSVRLGNSLFVEPLEPIVAMGYPKAGYGEDLTTSTGEITSIRTNVPGREGKDTLQHDAVITYGSSGGPLFSARGEVIGVNYAGDPPLNWAIPINDAIPLLRSIPGFDLRAMGQATTAMSASAVVDAYRGAVVFIDCTMEIAWERLLPDPSAIPGFPSEQLSTLHDTARLAGAGFHVIGGAQLAGDSGLYNSGWLFNWITVVALSDPDSAQRAAAYTLGSPTPKAQILGEGTLSASGVPVSYWMGFYHFSGPSQIFGRLECGCHLEGRVAFTLGSLAYDILLLWEIDQPCMDEFFYSLMPTWDYRDGYVVELTYPSGLSGTPTIKQRLVSGADFAAKLQGLANLVATMAVNRLSQ